MNRDKNTGRLKEYCKKHGMTLTCDYFDVDGRRDKVCYMYRVFLDHPSGSRAILRCRVWVPRHTAERLAALRGNQETVDPFAAVDLLGHGEDLLKRLTGEKYGIGGKVGGTRVMKICALFNVNDTDSINRISAIRDALGKTDPVYNFLDDLLYGIQKTHR